MPRPHRRLGVRAALALTAATTVTALAPIALTGAAAAAPVPPTGGTAGTSTPSPAALAAFVDGYVPGRLRDQHVPGAVVSVVAAGHVLFAKGYGVADVEHRTPFDPHTSLVRIASVTKLFTWTAVMQLVQQGELDLHADVNRYLDTFQVPATFARPITLLDLMDHTAGFEDRLVGVAADTAGDVPPLGTYLAAHMPARIRPPGEVSAYSNYGAALAGYIVARVSGEPYDAYVRRHILDPLGMLRSTASEPLPPALAPALASSYDVVDGRYVQEPFRFDVLAPDGSMSATAADLARFMLAHLQGGSLDGGRILDGPTTALMHTRSFTAASGIDGYAHGFKERTFAGHHVIMHDGGWEGFQSALVLVPDAGFGLFVGTNSVTGGEALGGLVPAVLQRFLPPAAPAASGAASPSRPADAGTAPVPGLYRPTRRAESTVERLGTLLEVSRVQVGPDGVVTFRGATWEPAGGGVHRRADGTDRLAFRPASDGGTYLVTDATAFELVPWVDTPQANLALLAGFGVTALGAVTGLPLVAGWRRLRRGPARRRPARLWRAARVLGGVSGGVGLLFLVLLGVLLSGEVSVIAGPPLDLRLLLLLPVLFLCLAAASLVATVMSWRAAGAGVAVRLHQVVVLGGALALAVFCLRWHLVGWQFG